MALLAFSAYATDVCVADCRFQMGPIALKHGVPDSIWCIVSSDAETFTQWTDPAASHLATVKSSPDQYSATISA